MRAARVTRLDGPDAVEVAEIDAPAPAAGQLLIDVHSAGVAFPEVLQTRGMYQLRPDPPFTPGSEVAGVIAAVPDGSAFQVGDRVAAFPGLGGFAEQVAVSEDMVFALPEATSYDAGAALPLNYLTAHFALLARGRLAAGEAVLVHGAAGGVGTASIQVAKAFGAGRVIAVTSSDQKAEVARGAGADAVVAADGFKDAVKDFTGGRGVDIVVDPVGGDRFTDSLRSLAPDGRALVIGFTAGEIPTVKVNRLLLNNIDVVGVGWGAYARDRSGYAGAQWSELLPHIRSGALAPPIGGTYALDQVVDALNAIDQRRAVGKILVNLR